MQPRDVYLLRVDQRVDLLHNRLHARLFRFRVAARIVIWLWRRAEHPLRNHAEVREQRRKLLVRIAQPLKDVLGRADFLRRLWRVGNIPGNGAAAVNVIPII